MDEGPRWTRAELVRRAAGGGLGLVLAGCGTGSRSGAATTATAAPSRPARPAARLAGDVHRFRSRPDLLPPVVTVLRNTGATAAGLLFLAPSSGPGQRGCLIVDDRGEPLWFHTTRPVTAMNLRAAVYRGKPVLTWWEGSTKQGLGTGSHVILDQSYRVVDRFPAGRGRPSDLHECLLTPRGTVLVTSWEAVRRDLRRAGGSRNGVVIGGIVQELELPSGRVLFEWHSLDHVAPEESHQKVGPRFDYFHVNSVGLAEDGNLIVSARNTWAIYKIGRRSGRVLWRLGGRRSDFAMGPGTVFAWQHDARVHDRGRLLSLFDNGGDPRVQPQSKALVLALDEKRMRATLHRRHVHRPPMRAHALGSNQLLPNGNVLVGWGTEPWFTEYGPGGEVVFDARLPRGGQNYRALRFPWVGRPSIPPRVLAAGGAAYASWNGATEVAAWQLRTGPRPGSLADGDVVPRQGFETMLPLPQGAQYVQAVALDAARKPLATSGTVRV
jgi:hypothetical protein